MIQSIIKRVKERFEKQFPKAVYAEMTIQDVSSNWKANDDIKDFLETEIRAAVKEVLEEVKSEYLRDARQMGEPDFRGTFEKINEILN